MAVLTYEPYDATNVTPRPAVRKSVFGDGYTQRSPTSVNNIKETWALLWDTKHDADIQALMDFFDANQDLAFDWTPPEELLPRKFVCRRYTRSYNVYTTAQTLNATIVEVFE